MVAESGGFGSRFCFGEWDGMLRDGMRLARMGEDACGKRGWRWRGTRNIGSRSSRAGRLWG